MNTQGHIFWTEQTIGTCIKIEKFLWFIFRPTLSQLLLQGSVHQKEAKTLLSFSISSDVKLLLADAVPVLFVVVSRHHHLVVVGTVGQQLPSFPWVADGAAGGGGGQYQKEELRGGEVGGGNAKWGGGGGNLHTLFFVGEDWSISQP